MVAARVCRQCGYRPARFACYGSARRVLRAAPASPQRQRTRRGTEGFESAEVISMRLPSASEDQRDCSRRTGYPSP